MMISTRSGSRPAGITHIVTSTGVPVFADVRAKVPAGVAGRRRSERDRSDHGDVKFPGRDSPALRNAEAFLRWVRDRHRSSFSQGSQRLGMLHHPEGSAFRVEKWKIAVTAPVPYVPGEKQRMRSTLPQPPSVFSHLA